ncbi:MAG: alkaline phosphatase family protein, partial [Verrucomicrobiae bacterium]|nr:alkaline phosphatase family protein [Verrucomicrobiae bacterium]
NGLSDAALANGPKEDGTLKAVSALDAALGEFFKKIEEKWTEIGPPDGNLGVILTTDHGMVSLEKNINLRQLLGEDLGKHLDIVAHDAIGHLYFKDMPENEGQKTLLIKQLDDELKKRIYFRTLKPEELPADWGYNVPGRIGDRVLVLKTGYAFTDHEAAEPVFDPSETSTFSAFGFPVEDSIRMSGQAIIWGWPNSPASGDLGEIGSQSFHATVCKMLGIQPAAGAVTDTLPVN